MKTRTATVADLPAILALERASATAAHWPEQSYAEILSTPSSRLLLVNEAQGAITGFIVAHSIAADCEIENVVVQLSSQRRGIGLQLLRELMTRAAATGIHRMFLEVRASNVAARRLYEKAGFRETGQRTAYYRSPDEDAVLYSRELVAARRNS